MRPISLFAASFLVLILATANIANADQGEAELNCTSAKQLVGAASAFHGEKPELTNLIDPQLKIEMKGINGHPDPTHLLYKFEGYEHAMPIKEGQLQGLEAAKGWSKNGELCSIYEDGPLGDTEEDAVSLAVSFSFPFRREDGVFSVKEIKEGVKDGTKIIKGLAPRGLGFAAPNLQTFVVSPDGEDSDMPEIIFTRDGKPTTVKMSQFNQTQYVRMKDIKSARVDGVKILGPHKAHAFFKIDPAKIAENEAKRLASGEGEAVSETENN